MVHGCSSSRVGYAICIWSRTSVALGFVLFLNHENPIKVQRYESSNNSRPGLDRGEDERPQDLVTDGPEDGVVGLVSAVPQGPAVVVVAHDSSVKVSST